MSASAVLSPTRAGLDERAGPDRTLGLVEAMLGSSARSRRAVVDRLCAYYAPESAHCGTNFLDGTECEQPGTVTPADLFAVTTLGISVHPAAARRLLHDTEYARRIESCLSLDRLPHDAALPDPPGPPVEAMLDLHDAILSALDPPHEVARPSHTAAAALCARKRPELFPILDPRFCAALQLPSAAFPYGCWQIVRRILREQRVSDTLANLFAATRAARPGVQLDVYPLRQLYVLARVS
jgi:hypothetical protein